MSFNIVLKTLLVISVCVTSLICARSNARRNTERCIKFARQCENVTAEEILRYCERRSIVNRKDNVHMERLLTRRKRQGCSGLPIRKEIRMMSVQEWNDFKTALQAIKSNGQYDALVAMHRGYSTFTAHKGPNFLGWHRIYLYYFQYYLQMQDPCVVLPYWDSTLDYEIEDPTTTILFTDHFLGNGHGNVTSGPFGSWRTARDLPLERNIGANGTLISKEFMSQVLSRTSHADIIKTTPEGLLYNLEDIHNGVHQWMDGNMVLVDEASEDPVFFMTHAYVDCWWQKFIEKNKLFKDWAIFDYPFVSGYHYSDNLMYPFSSFKNRDGYADYLYDDVYRCDPFPSCSSENLDCGSPYLTCDTTNYICVSNATTEYRKKRQVTDDVAGTAIPLGIKFQSAKHDSRDKFKPLPQKQMPQQKPANMEILDIEGIEMILLSKQERRKRDLNKRKSDAMFFSCDNIRSR